ncbi:MAG: HAD hydrolase-like protein [Clostridia bacterium]|nr:HAD hydrolase-like protein [Clostridia bacterium]
MGKYKAVLFDLDGTVLDTSEGILLSIEQTIEELGLKKIAEEDRFSFIGPPIEWSFEDKCGIEGEALTKACASFRDKYANYNILKAVPYEGIFDLMAALKVRGVKTAIATYKKESYAIGLLEHFGFNKYYDVVHGSDPKGELKKSDIIELCLKEMGIDDYSEVLMVGDSKHDAGGAAAINVDFAGVSYGFGFGPGKAERIEDYPHVIYVDKPIDILKVF